MDTTALVPVKSAWLSKINWTAVLGAAGTLITTNALGLPAETQVKILAFWGLAQNVATFILRTWYNGTVSQTSLPK
jgi:hypothetical protein